MADAFFEITSTPMSSNDYVRSMNEFELRTQNNYLSIQKDVIIQIGEEEITGEQLEQIIKFLKNTKPEIFV